MGLFKLTILCHIEFHISTLKMVFEIKVESIFECSLERAFKTAILTDISKIHTGYGFMPIVTHVSDDEDWGKPGSTKKVHVKGSILQKEGYAFMDRILERSENDYWKIQVDEFQSWTLGFHKFVGRWKVSQLETNKILIEYTYWLHSNSAFLYPLNWMFAKLFYKRYMKRVLENVRVLTLNNEPYLYE